MASTDVIDLVRTLAHDAESSRLLRADPERLAAKHRLGAPALAALWDADRFFKTEKPILQRAVATPFPPRPPSPPLQIRSFVAASSDTGTLLPGPDTGTFSATGSGSGTALAPALPSPSAPGRPGLPGRPTAPLAPAPLSPVVPAVPAIPALPAAPVAPAMPWSKAPYAPASPLPVTPQTVPPGGWPSPADPAPSGPSRMQPTIALPGLPAGSAGCCCTAAIVATTGMVCATAQASISAIAAMAAQSRTRHGS